MQSFDEYMGEYRKQLKKGAVPKAYRGLMEYMMSLRAHFAECYPQYSVSGSLYQGYMDMTYFAFAPVALQRRKLKVAVVFLHEACRFEAWLAAANKQVQAQYWRLIKDSGWEQYQLVPAVQGADSILEYVLDEAPSFRDLAVLTAALDKAALQFSRDVEGFLARR